MNYTLEDIKKQSPYPIGELNTAYAKYFVGNSYLYSINDQEVLISNVTFEPGCRNNWHIHHGAGQILLCTAGRGYYQEWGKPAQELNVGDTVYIAPEIKHWHGAHQKAILCILQKVYQMKMLQTSGLKQWMKKNI